MQRDRSLTQQRGVTLIDACITVAIVSILVGTGAPSFIDFNERRALDGRASEMATDLYLARSEAVVRQQGVRASFHGLASGSCMLIHTGVTADCHCENGGVSHCVNGADLIKSVFYATSSGVGVTANVSSIRFDPTHGMASPTGTVRVTAASGPAVHHVVSIMGRVRTCSPMASAKGYKMC